VSRPLAAALLAASACGRGASVAAVDAAVGPIDVVLFTATAAFRHEAAIAASVPALQALAAERGWRVMHTEDRRFFAAGALDAVEVVVFLYTSGDVLEDSQQAVLEAHLARGGGFVGVHSASDTEYGWPWYAELVGAFFAGHPAGTPNGTIVVDAAHGSTAHLPPRWTRDEEWYSFGSNPAELPGVQVLMTLDETTVDLPPSLRMGLHPLAWLREVHGGRSFYTALGHAGTAWTEVGFASHIAGAIDWSAQR
jgi:type 1 glutamine amidotransferase